MNRKQFIKTYLIFSKKDRIGIYCVLGLLVLIYLLPLFSTKTSPRASITADTALAGLLDTLQQQHKTTNHLSNEQAFAYEPTTETGFSKGTLFPFDPNTLSAEGWQRLGLKERSIKTILNYRAKGGKFYKPEDLQKIWGLPAGFYDYVARHIQITSIPPATISQPTNIPTPPQKKERRIAVIDINTADTTAFIALPGIGAKLASRIVNFRDKLGGFYTIDQVKETYGLPDSTFQKIKSYLQVNATTIKKLNINTATKEELKTHPYIRWQLANAIVEYRNQHGLYKNLNELSNIVSINNEVFNKIVPYLAIE